MNTRPFLDHLNSLRHTIQFTMELEKDGSLPFLDILLTRKEDGSTDIEVYRKNTHTDQYLHYNCHHPQHVKRGVALCLFSHARTVAMGENVGKEVKHITGFLKANGYPEHVIKSAQ